MKNVKYFFIWLFNSSWLHLDDGFTNSLKCWSLHFLDFLPGKLPHKFIDLFLVWLSLNFLIKINKFSTNFFFHLIKHFNNNFMNAFTTFRLSPRMKIYFFINFPFARSTKVMWMKICWLVKSFMWKMVY